MTQNDEYTYDLNLKYSVTAGNAGNILVLINNNKQYTYIYKSIIIYHTNKFNNIEKI